MTEREALKLALRALERLACLGNGVMRGNSIGNQIAIDALTAIKEALAQPKSEYERGFIDGMQKQMQSSVDKAVNAMTQPTYYIPNKDERTWVGLTNDELTDLFYNTNLGQMSAVGQAIALLKERNS
jgi:hypothetical protein